MCIYGSISMKMFSNLCTLPKLMKLSKTILDKRTISLSLARSKQDTSTKYDKFKFKFNEENECRVQAMMKWYPKGEERGALLPLLDLAQRQQGWLSITAIAEVAKILKIEPFDAFDVAQFYTMFHLTPHGKFVVCVCTSTPCFLRGSDDLLKTCERMLDVKAGETTKDMAFTLATHSCMGACVNAPVISVNDDFYEDLTEVDVETILCELKSGRIPAAGPRNGRCAGEPKPGPTTLLIEPPPAGYMMQDLSKSKNDCK